MRALTNHRQAAMRQTGWLSPWWWEPNTTQRYEDRIHCTLLFLFFSWSASYQWHIRVLTPKGEGWGRGAKYLPWIYRQLSARRVLSLLNDVPLRTRRALFAVPSAVVMASSRFSTQRRWTALTPFWFSAENVCLWEVVLGMCIGMQTLM